MKPNGSALHDELQRTTQRWGVAAAAHVNRHVRESMRQAVEAQSRKLVATAWAETANRALRRFTELCYDGDGSQLYNVGREGRILIPTPWSRSHYAAYGLTDHTARVLRVVVMSSLVRLPIGFQLFHCPGRTWYLNTTDYPTVADAHAWLDRFLVVTPGWWDAANRQVPRRGAG